MLKSGGLNSRLLDGKLFFIPFTEILTWFTAFISILSGYTYYKDLSNYIFESI